MDANPDRVKENRIWWLVLALMAATTSLLVLSYIDKAQWQTIILTLFGTFVTGVALNVVAQGAKGLMESKGEATKTTASANADVSRAKAMRGE